MLKIFGESYNKLITQAAAATAGIVGAQVVNEYRTGLFTDNRYRKKFNAKITDCCDTYREKRDKLQDPIVDCKRRLGRVELDIIELNLNESQTSEVSEKLAALTQKKQDYQKSLTELENENGKEMAEVNALLSDCNQLHLAANEVGRLAYGEGLEELYSVAKGIKSSIKHSDFGLQRQRVQQLIELSEKYKPNIMIHIQNYDKVLTSDDTTANFY